MLYWIDGTPVAGGYTTWSKGNPSNSGNENCGHILGEVGGGYEEYDRKWNDLPCALVGWNQNIYPVIIFARSPFRAASSFSA